MSVFKPLQSIAACRHSLSRPNLAYNSWPVVCVYKLHFVWIGVLCHPCGAKNSHNVAFSTKFSHFGRLLCPPFTDPSQILEETINLWSTLMCKISLESVYCVTFQGSKCTILGNFWYLGAPVPSPFTDEHYIWCARAEPWSMLTCQILSRSVYPIAL